MSREYRRIVTTDDSNEKSDVLIDGAVTSELASFMPRIWLTDAGATITRTVSTTRCRRALSRPWAAPRSGLPVRPCVGVAVVIPRRPRTAAIVAPVDVVA